MRRSAALCLALLALAAALRAAVGVAGERPPPEGPVLLTVAGAVEHWNRGPTEPFADAFFAYHGIAFERALAFDLAMLEALPQRRIRTAWPGWPGAFALEGPLLADLLAAAGATGRTVTALALDGYAATLAPAEIAAWGAVLALKKDGRHLGLGDRGPLWLVYPREGAGLAGRTDDAGLVWALFFLRVE